MQAFGSHNFEALESRRMLDGTATLTAGVLTITGTEQHDAVVITVDATDNTQLDVKVNKTNFAFDASSITSINISTGGGADRIVVSEKNGAVTLPVTVDSGAGSDLIATASGDDVINSGDGSDTINSGSGNDQIDAGNGNDVVNAGNGDDSLLGDNGKDNLKGGDGNDDLDGGNGKDSINTGTGTDQVATDPAHPKEVVSRNPATHEYDVASFTDLPQEIQDLHESLVPGSHVFKVEVDNGIITMMYTFDGDPKSYKTVVDATGDTLQLTSRQLSLNELRSPAVDVFVNQFSGSAILGVVEHGQSYYDVRFRDADGTIKSTTTHEILFGEDEADHDLDNDGIYDGSTLGEDGMFGTPVSA